MAILAPFSGKFKYNTRNFPPGNYKSPRLNLANINTHYDMSSDHEYEYCIQKYDVLLEEDFKLFDMDCVPEKQPFWDLQKNQSLDNHAEKPSLCSQDEEGKPVLGTEEADRMHEVCSDNIDETTKEECEGIELLAWYASAHFHESENYGIHLIPVGIVYTAEALLQNCKKYNLNISRRMAVVWAMNILYCHELVHSWIEDIASLIEFSTGNDIYTATQQKYKSYILMEEALCNTAVYGLQLSFLERDKGKHFEARRKHQAENDHLIYNKDINSDFDKDKMMRALNDFMRSQPKGYRDYVEISNDPHESFLFIRGLINLFKNVYQHDQIYNELYEAIDLYFGIDTHRAMYSENISEADICFGNCRRYDNSISWRDEVPVRMHIPQDIFCISGNKNLTSLKDCPDKVDDFCAFNCNLKSLKGAPTVVKGSFIIYDNKNLKSLKGCPKIFGKIYLWNIDGVCHFPNEVLFDFQWDRNYSLDKYGFIERNKNLKKMFHIIINMKKKLHKKPEYSSFKKLFILNGGKI